MNRSMSRVRGRRRGVAAAALLALVFGCSNEGDTGTSSNAPPATPEPAAAAFPGVATIRVGNRDVEAEVVWRVNERNRGLMDRHVLPQDHGMLFVFPDDKPRAFHMMNTLIPLTIAFLDADGKIIDLIDMDPDPDGGEGSYADSSAPARFALEMNQGWFAGQGVKAGDVVAIPESVRKLPAERDRDFGY